MTARIKLTESQAAQLRADKPHKAKGPKRRGSTGSGLVRTILEYLRIKGIFAFRVGNSGVKRQRDGREFWTFGGMRGVSDIIAVLPVRGWVNVGNSPYLAGIVGRILCIEAKEGTGRQTKEQREFQAQVERAGGLYVLARSLEDVRRVVG